MINSTLKIDITVHIDELRNFYGESWKEVSEYGTFKNPIDIVQFCRFNWTDDNLIDLKNQNAFFPTITDGLTMEWNLKFLDDGKRIFPAELFLVLQMLNRPVQRNRTFTHKGDWEKILDFSQPTTVSTNGTIDPEGNIHLHIDDNNLFRIKAASKILLPYNLSYTVLFTIPITISNGNKELLYCEIDPVVRNNTDQG